MPEDDHRYSHEQRRRFWRQHVEGWQQSGLSQIAYCRSHDLKVQQFYRWRRRIMAAAPRPVSFLPVTIASAPRQPPAAIRIHTPNGFTIEVDSHEGGIELGQLIATVSGL
jgi:transposase-like protein